MNYHKYLPLDVVNGEGTRVTLFVSGCEHNCKGCYNKSTLNPNSGHPFTKEMEDQIISDLKDTRIPRRGLSISGGDPLHPANVEAVTGLCRRVKEECPDKDIWVWTGYTHQYFNIEQKELMRYVDTVIDGVFIEAKKDLNLKWRGSSNQNVIHLNKC